MKQHDWLTTRDRGVLFLLCMFSCFREWLDLELLAAILVGGDSHGKACVCVVTTTSSTCARHSRDAPHPRERISGNKQPTPSPSLPNENHHRTKSTHTQGSRTKRGLCAKRLRYWLCAHKRISRVVTTVGVGLFLRWNVESPSNGCIADMPKIGSLETGREEHNHNNQHLSPESSIGRTVWDAGFLDERYRVATLFFFRGR